MILFHHYRAHRVGECDLKTILYIEDTTDQRDMVALILKMQEFHVKVANDGFEGLKMARELLPDLILLDLGMPRMDGFSVIDRLKEDEQTREIPIVILSAWTDTHHRKRAMIAGVNDFVAKPFDMNYLVDVIRKHI